MSLTPQVKQFQHLTHQSCVGARLQLSVRATAF